MNSLTSKLFFQLFTLLVWQAQAQDWHLSDSLEFQSDIKAVSQDALDNLYVADANGSIIKYSVRLEKQEAYTNRNLNEISNLDAEQLLKIFVFSEHTQQYQFFNRFLNPTQVLQNINFDRLARISAATLSSDQMIWLVDETNLQLIKFNPILEEVVLTTDLNYYLTEEMDVRQLQEHNNRLFLLQNQEIWVFDFMGNFVSKLPLREVLAFSLYHQHLYYYDGEQINVFNLSSLQQETTGIKPEKKVKHLLSTVDKLYTFSENTLKVYRRLASSDK